jgi:hypothetical protein
MVRCAIMIWIGAHFRPLGQIGRKNQEMKREAQTIFKMIWIFGLFALPVAAQSTPSDHDVLAAQERVQISGTLIAGAWMPRLGGNASLETSSGGSGTEIDFITQLNYRDLEPTFQGIFHLHVNDWTFGIEGFRFSTSGSGTAGRAFKYGDVTLKSGDKFSSSLRWSSVAVDVAYKLWHPIQYSKEPNHPLGSKNVDFTISPLLGVRWIDVEQNLSRNGGKSDTGYGQWAAAYIGLRGKLSIELPENTPLLKIIELTAECGAGATFGSELGTVAQVRANLNLYLTEQVAVSLGYRYFAEDSYQEDFEFKGHLAGLFLGIKVDF